MKERPLQKLEKRLALIRKVEETELTVNKIHETEAKLALQRVRYAETRLIVLENNNFLIRKVRDPDLFP